MRALQRHVQSLVMRATIKLVVLILLRCLSVSRHKSLAFVFVNFCFQNECDMNLIVTQACVLKRRVACSEFCLSWRKLGYIFTSILYCLQIGLDRGHTSLIDIHMCYLLAANVSMSRTCYVDLLTEVQFHMYAK